MSCKALLAWLCYSKHDAVVIPFKRINEPDVSTFFESAVDLAGFRKVRAKEARPVGACQGCLVLESAPGEEERRRWDLALDLVRALTEEVPGVPSPDLGKQSVEEGGVLFLAKRCQSGAGSGLGSQASKITRGLGIEGIEEREIPCLDGVHEVISNEMVKQRTKKRHEMPRLDETGSSRVLSWLQLPNRNLRLADADVLFFFFCVCVCVFPHLLGATEGRMYKVCHHLRVRPGALHQYCKPSSSWTCSRPTCSPRTVATLKEHPFFEEIEDWRFAGDQDKER